MGTIVIAFLGELFPFMNTPTIDLHSNEDSLALVAPAQLTEWIAWIN